LRPFLADRLDQRRRRTLDRGVYIASAPWLLWQQQQLWDRLEHVHLRERGDFGEAPLHFACLHARYLGARPRAPWKISLADALLESRGHR